MTVMRAKMVITKVERGEGYERLCFMAVGPNAAYPSDGSDENNTFARWTPSAELTMHVNNPDLHGKFEQGMEFYLDFKPAFA